MTCKDCRFSYFARLSDMGVCRRHPPVIIQSEKGANGYLCVFPDIHPSHLCGDYRLKKSA